MSFKRFLNDDQIQKMLVDKNRKRFDELKTDVESGTVFPAVRQNTLDFYYKGGRLYRFVKGSFKRDENYEKIKVEDSWLSDYEIAKRQNEIRFVRRDGEIAERQLLDKLNAHTFDPSYAGDAVVLDIEVDLNGEVGKGKKCDMVIFNRRTGELMFVEGKVFSDGRVNVAVPFTPEVISQVDIYTAAIEEQRDNILEQYKRHIEIINGLFGVSFRPPQKLIEPAKLIVYGVPESLTQNGKYAIDKINSALGANNVLWIESNDDYPLDRIWNLLTK